MTPIQDDADTPAQTFADLDIHPAVLKAVAEKVAHLTAWTKPTIPAPGDPGPFRGTPALV